MLQPTYIWKSFRLTKRALLSCAIAAWTVCCGQPVDDGELGVPCDETSPCAFEHECGEDGFCKPLYVGGANFGNGHGDAYRAPADGGASRPHFRRSDAGTTAPLESNDVTRGKERTPTDDGCASPEQCDDGLSCTEDACVEGICSHKLDKLHCLIDDVCLMATSEGKTPCEACIPSKSQTQWSLTVGATCNDGLACTTTDKCDEKGQCTGTMTAGCCETDKDCDDGLPCTTGACDLAMMQCLFFPKPGCCSKDVHCKGTATSCAIPACDQATSKCVMKPHADGGACDDGDSCTEKDVCAAGACKGHPKCDDGKPCTADFCAAGKCTHSKVDDCCAQGACCDIGKQKFKPAQSLCGAEPLATQTKCNGNFIMRREAHGTCSGTSSSCVNEQAAWGWTPWKKFQNCGDGTCVQAAGSASCKAPPPPPADLLLSALHTDLKAYQQGAKVHVQVVVENQGKGAAMATALELRLSADTKFDASDKLLLKTSVSALAGGAMWSKKQSFTLPAQQSAGSWFIVGRVDVSNLLKEASEANNVASAPLTILPPLMADLRAVAVKPASSTVFKPGKISAIAEVKNIGTAASKPCEIEFRLSKDNKITSKDSLLQTDKVPSLAPGQVHPIAMTAALSANWKAGPWRIGARVDPKGAVTEKTKANNTASHPVTLVTAPPAETWPDLKAVKLTAPTAMQLGHNVTSKLIIANAGFKSSGAFRVSWQLSNDFSIDGSDPVVAAHDVPSMAAASKITVSTKFKLPPGLTAGKWVLAARVDSAGAIKESDEQNNVAFTVITATPPAPPAKPDLVANQLIIKPAVVIAGQSFQLSADLGAHTADVSTQFRLEFRACKSGTLSHSDIILGHHVFQGLKAGTTKSISHTLQLPATTIAGGWHIALVVDSLNQVSETREDNNTRFTALKVVTPPPPKPDLSIHYFKPSTATFLVGGLLKAMAVIRNTAVTSAGAAEVTLMLSKDGTASDDDIWLGTENLPTLQANAQHPVSFAVQGPSKLAAGTYHLLLVVDSSTKVIESDEANNIGVEPIQLVSPTN